MTALAPRVTQRLMVERSLTSLQTGLGRVVESQERLSTGRAITRPSDSPTGTNAAMRLRDQLAANTQHARNADDGLGWLGRTDDTLTSMQDSVRRARELMLQGASTGSTGVEARAALAKELTLIRDELLGGANTTHMGRPIFGGTTTQKAAYAADGSYQGDGAEISRTVGENLRVRVNLTGPEAFGPPGDDLFTVLADAVTAMRTDPAQLGAQLDRLEVAAERMRTAQADAGTRYGRVEKSLALIQDAEVDLTASLSEVENVDIAKAAVDLQMQEVAYQAALGATARVMQPSLLDFLR